MGLPKPRIAEPQPVETLPLFDVRFRRLVGAEAWARLPAAVQARFAKRVAGDEVKLYRGRITATQFSALGWLAAQACRLLGAPLPLHVDVGTPAVVSVSEDCASGGQCWTRIYGRRSGFPQVIHSAKRFAGPTGLEEYVGRGVGMALRVDALEDGLAFVSDHYFLMLAGHRIRLPRWLAPGDTRVEHRDLGAGRFAFNLDLRHPVFGLLVRQEAEFVDA